MTETEENKKTRNRRTRAQVIADMEAKLAKLRAKDDGTYDESQDDTFLVKRLKRAIRSRETAIKQSTTLLDGRAGTEKSPPIANIDTKIANALSRIENMREAKVRAQTMIAQLPFDIQTLRAALETAEGGTEVAFPEGLFLLPKEEDKTESEIEASAANLSD